MSRAPAEATPSHRPRRGEHLLGVPFFPDLVDPANPLNPANPDYLFDERPDVPVAKLGHLIQEDPTQLSALFGGYAHDVKNRLAAAKVAAEEALYITRSPEIRRLLNAVLIGVERGEELSIYMGDILKAPGREMRPVHLGEVISTAVVAKIPQFKAQKIEVKMDISASTPEIIGEEGLLSDALTNLLVNAYDAIRSRRMREDIDPSDDIMRVGISSFADLDKEEAVISVSDTGIGIAPEDIERIGAPYFTKGKEKGTGLGLYMVRKTITGHGGSLEVESLTRDMIDQYPHLYGDMIPGTTFTIRLPTHQ